jgi:hypothetical protein
MNIVAIAFVKSYLYGIHYHSTDSGYIYSFCLIVRIFLFKIAIQLAKIRSFQ